jgi:hypothetical protein
MTIMFNDDHITRISDLLPIINSLQKTCSGMCCTRKRKIGMDTVTITPIQIQKPDKTGKRYSQKVSPTYDQL